MRRQREGGEGARGPGEGGKDPTEPRTSRPGGNPEGATGREAGKARGVGRSESQETCPGAPNRNRSSREDWKMDRRALPVTIELCARDKDHFPCLGLIHRLEANGRIYWTRCGGSEVRGGHRPCNPVK